MGPINIYKIRTDNSEITKISYIIPGVHLNLLNLVILGILCLPIRYKQMTIDLLYFRVNTFHLQYLFDMKIKNN